jgi:hypothetical protein
MFDSEAINAIAGIAALVNSLVLVPSVLALRKLAANHDGRITKLEVAPAKPRRKRGRV